MGWDKEKARLHQRERRKIKKQEGLCISCCARKPEFPNVTCSVCIERISANKRKKRQDQSKLVDNS